MRSAARSTAPSPAGRRRKPRCAWTRTACRRRRRPRRARIGRASCAAIDACLKVRHAERPQSVAQLRPMLLGQAPQPRAGRALAADAQGAERAEYTADRLGPAPCRRSGWPLLPRWQLLGGAYGGYEYTRWQPAEPGTRDAEARQLAALIGVRRKEAAGRPAAGRARGGTAAQGGAEAQPGVRPS